MEQDNANICPGTITSIQPQKRNTGRYSIFVDEQFLIGISETVLLKFDLQKGHYLSSDEFREIRNYEEFATVEQYCYTLLSNREHTRKELYIKAKRKGYDSAIINKVLDTLESKEMLNPESFARSYARDKSKINKWGPRKIKSALLQKGIDRNLADTVSDEVIKTDELYTIFERLLSKKKRKLQKVEQRRNRRKKAFDYLRRKGYYTQQILKYLDDLMDSLNL